MSRVINMASRRGYSRANRPPPRRYRLDWRDTPWYNFCFVWRRVAFALLMELP